MKILHLVENYSPSKGGMQEVVKQLSERLVLLGHDITVATKENEDRKEEVINGVKIKGFNVSGNFSAGLKGDVKEYEKFLIDSDFDIVSCFAAQQSLTDIALPLLDKIKGKKVFIPTGFSGLYSTFHDEYFKKMEKWMKDFDANVFLAEDYRDVKFARDNGVTKRILIPNGADEREFLAESNLDVRKELGIPESHFLILHIGSHTNQKGHKEAIEIFNNADVRNATFVINGNVYPEGENCNEYCKTEVDKFNSNPIRTSDGKKILLTDLDRIKLVPLFKSANLFLFPSNIEASPVVLFEAMAAHTPFLTSNAGNSAEITKWSNGGIVLPTLRKFPNGNVEVDVKESTNILEDLFKDKEKLKKLSEDGYRVWEEKYTWEKISKEYEKLYNDVLDNNFKGVDETLENKVIDVIIPAYNQASFILDTIKAIENQTVKPRQIIIIDDGSKDNTEEVIKNYKSEVKINYVKKENGGPNSARNAGIKLSDAEFIGFCDADDVWEKDKLESQLRVFETTPLKNVGLVYSKYSVIDEKGENLQNAYIFPLDPNVRGYVFDDLLETNKVTGSASAVLIKRSCFETAGYYDENLQTHEDWDKWLELAQKFEFDYVYKSLVKIRRHGTNRQSDGQLMFTNELKFLNKWATQVPVEKIPTSWEFSIANQVINRLSDMSFFKLAMESLTQESKNKIFNDTNGSMKLYILKRCAVIFRTEFFYALKQVLRIGRNGFLIIFKV
ncbi:MAG: glycosyltransferase [Candidatus Dojkabacteria bacterium]